MVKLTDDYVDKQKDFNLAGIEVPKYSQEEVSKETDKTPLWVHFGGGNLFRCFHAVIAQKLLNEGIMKSGVIVAETYDDQVIEDIYHAYNNRILSVTMDADGSLQKKLVASVASSVYFNDSNPTGWEYLTNVFENPSLQFATFSITEKGYSLRDSSGNLTKFALEDIVDGPAHPKTNMGAVAHLLYARFLKNQAPIAMVSTDNFSENGAKLENAILTIANGWFENGLVEAGFLDYLKNTSKVTFPWSMIDRITPNPAETVAEKLEKVGFEDSKILHTAKHTNIAPFGNTEETHYLVIEDAFPNGRPALEKAGVILTDRDTVNDADQMKVTACLNPLHTALAIFGNLLGYKSIWQEVENSDLLGLIKNLGYKESLPVVKDPKIINPKVFIDQLINKRLPNRNIPDTPQRIATDTSQKLKIRYGVTIQHYLDEPAFDVANLEFIPLVIAGWCRYLMGVDDQGQEFDLSPDPMLTELKPKVADISLGEAVDVDFHLKDILSNKEIFGFDLYKIGLGEKVEKYFEELISGKEAVAKTIKKTVAEKGTVFA
ncbi:mannitol dehydrogenase family protein [Liquorilactobacillus mali]|uniref:mannitol dehydrogenase family protein n=1 Tax=Liquorilactobacillus mali TaxID=1618 RepID=UPI0026563F7C|nr:mannitol dehydrogenase family protein [Liquorilactobacillus mali]MDN7144810.1 mannitol dehydrogenase family protein [Liquorilactobacillus mali]